MTRLPGDRRKGKTDWARVDALTDGDILDAVKSDPDAVLLDDKFWRTAKFFSPAPKVAISLRVDRDVMDFFKSQGPRYQTRMNAVLRSYVEHKRRA
ncbi:MAG: BrnA antitoxin family protein [Rhodospirillaceae bacterium]|nr:BrnA antitoxin family protein [Rhodospirillaceae bacterium]